MIGRSALFLTTALVAALAAPILEADAQGQACRLNACWPAFDYDGKPAQTDGLFSSAVVAGSQAETAHYAAESRTMLFYQNQ
jgi:hypothetical protein